MWGEKVGKIIILMSLFFIVIMSVVMGNYTYQYNYPAQFEQDEVYQEILNDVSEPVYILGESREFEKILVEEGWVYDQIFHNYKVSRITYEEFITELVSILEQGAISGVLTQPGALWEVTVDASSKYRIFVQDNLERSISTVLIVTLGEASNKVSIVHSGTRVLNIILQEDGDHLRFVLEGEERLIRWRDLSQ